MKLSKQTIEILKHCAKINPGIVINPARKDKPPDPTGAIRTITSNKTLLFQAIVPESFPADTAIYNLEAFLKELTPQTEVCLEYADRIELRNGRVIRKLPRVDPLLVLTQPAGNIKVTSYEEKVFLHVDDLQWMRLPKRFPRPSKSNNRSQKSAVYIEIYSEGKGKPIQIDIERGGIVESIECKVPRLATQPFRAVFNNSNLVLLTGSYEVELSKIGLARCKWLHGDDVTFWISFENDKTWFGEKARDERLERERVASAKRARAIVEQKRQADQLIAREITKEETDKQRAA